MYKKLVQNLLLFVLLVSCSGGISLLSERDDVSPEFTIEMKEIKKTYKSGNIHRAIVYLNNLKLKRLRKVEHSVVDNMLGVIYFAKQDYHESVKFFEDALINSDKNSTQVNQIYLNLSSGYLKLDKIERAFVNVEQIDSKKLNEKELDNYYQLYYRLSKQMDDEFSTIKNLVFMHKKYSTLIELKTSKYIDEINEKYLKLIKTQRMHLLEELEDEDYVVVGYLGLIEIKNAYFRGKKEEAKEILYWVKNNFSKYEGIISSTSNIENSMKTFTQIDSFAIGVVAPLSGSTKTFGIRLLEGIDTSINGELKELGFNSKIIVKDSKDIPIIAARNVRELIEKHNVKYIIGGVLSKTAIAEYLEARRLGVLFISLSPIYLPKDEKNHLLIEVRGSVESQIKALIKPEVLAHIGPKFSLLYPKGEFGENYLNEFWRVSQQNDVNLVNAYEFERNITDYRSPIEKLLGLKFKNERSEELTYFSDLHKQKKRSVVRRLQTLPPVVDFDWVFIPSNPREALQILPLFKYFDTKKVKFVGGPTWKSKSVMKNQRSLGTMYFVGENNTNDFNSYKEKYQGRYFSKAGLVQRLGYEAISIGEKLSLNTAFTNRDQFEAQILNSKKLDTKVSNWTLDEGVWIKQMKLLRIFRGEVTEVALTQVYAPKEPEVETIENTDEQKSSSETPEVEL
jgi:outer membrane PBP1 activator LpoA protein